MKIYPKDCNLVFKGADSLNQSLSLSQKISELGIDSSNWFLYQNLAVRDNHFQLMKKDVLRVWVPDGIGDLHWIFLKLASLKEKCGASKLVVVKRDLSHTQDHFKRKDRVLPFLKMNPIIDEVELTFKQPFIFEEGFVLNDMGFDYVLDPNPFLLTGARIEEYLPELEIDWDYLEDFPAYDSKKVLTGPPVFYFGDRHSEVIWGGKWSDRDWKRVLNHVVGLCGDVVVVGLTSDLSKAHGVSDAGAFFKSLIGQTTFEECFQLITTSRLVVGSISGLTILSAALGVPTVAMWPDGGSLQPLPEKMRTSWVRDKVVGSTYCPFGYSSSVDSVIKAIEGLL